MASQPLVVKPVAVVDTPALTISEYFGHVASKDGTASFAMVEVKEATEAGFQAPQFQEHVICTEGSIELVYGDGARCRIPAGQGAFLPKGLRVKWTWPEATKYTVVCLPAFSPELVGSEAEGTKAVDSEAKEKLKDLHAGTEVEAPKETAAPDAVAQPTVVAPVNVVEAPGITISEHFGHVASKDGVCSLAVAVVKEASEEAFQAPLFDEFVICNEGSIEFVHGDDARVRIKAGEGIFLPKGLRVKWIWPEATKYTVLCLPAFSPELSGREAEEGATVAKDSASMQKLEELHQASATAMGA